MFATLIMNSNKELQRTTTPTIYQNENNADEILILLPQKYGNVSIKDCSVTINLLQTTTDNTNTGNIKLLEFKEDLYKDLYLQAIVPITVTETATAGMIEVFLNIVHETNQVDIKTGSTFLEIKKHKKVTDFIQDGQIDLLSDYLIKMQQLMNSCNVILTQATEQADKATQSANLIITLMKEWEDEHNV
jgi:hypothetical protein